ncbi:MAG: S-adenosylmethionine:tRNA ribosyltransferase-isomerase [Patescibacteria group bacterium]|nr:S-adenosylmethionine:tRNA ribosyltransferase-isomerase [Patescibacteria group bacterium]
MKTSNFDYNLPLSLIAQRPIKKRDHSRLLVLDKKRGNRYHQKFYEILDFLQAGDLLILNNSRVFPARLLGKKALTGGEVEIFLHRKKKITKTTVIWECLLRGKVKAELQIILSKKMKAKLIALKGDGLWLVEFNLGEKAFWQEVEKIGEVPLPPYIKRDKKRAEDKKRYQTVYCRRDEAGSVAAPTAGLHFDKKLLKKIAAKGVEIKFITLNVGLGTFATVKTDEIEKHKMHSEYVEIKKEVALSIYKAKQEKRRIIAVGTTSCRALEAGAKKILETKGFSAESLCFWTDIFIYPGYKFKIVDGLVTNFHLPKSTLLMLVSALAGQKNIEKAYQEAVSLKYRFFSYGDAMFII